MKRLDRYFFFELAKTTTLASIIAIVVLLALQILRLTDFIIDRAWDAAFFGKMMTGLGLSLTPLVIPIAFLFALLVVYGRMSTEREFVAMQSLGQSPLRFLKPSLFFAYFVFGMTFYACFSLGPYGNRLFERCMDEAWQKKVMSVLKSGTFSESFLGMVIFADQVDPITQDLTHVFIHDEKSFKDEVSISAKKGQWIPPEEKQDGLLKLKDGFLISQNLPKEIVRRVHFDEYRVHADFDRSIGHDKGSPQSMSGSMLLARRRAQSKTSDDPKPVWVEIARRLAATFSCLLFVPLCLGISLDNRRTAKGRAIFSGLIILITYWTAYFSILSWLLESPWKPLQHSEALCYLLIWLPNFCLFIFGILIMNNKMRLAQS